MKLIFAGTPDFAVPSLRALMQAGYEVCAVYTQPDRPAGRGRALRPSPVKQVALEYGLPVCQPESLRTPEEQEKINAFAADVMIVVAYGLLLPEPVLSAPRLGCINVHASLLPRWCGAAPIQRAILAGDTQSGVTIMQMERGLDTGAMFHKVACAIDRDETAQSLHDKLAPLGAEALLDVLVDLHRDQCQLQPQDDTQAVYAKKIKKSEAVIDWRLSAEQLARHVRAFNPWPVSVTRWQDQALRIWSACALEKAAATVRFGTVLACTSEGIEVACGEGVLSIQELQLSGKRRVQVKDFLNAHRAQMSPGETRFGEEAC